MATCETIRQVPGPTGAAGADGSDGIDGKNAFSTSAASFVMPAASGSVNVTVDDNTWASPTSGGVTGQVVHVQNAGYFYVTGKTGTTVLNLTNIGTAGNAAAGATIPTSSRIAPAGLP